MLIGALATGVAKAVLEGYFVYMGAQGQPQNGKFPYITIPGAEFVPPLDVWISCAGVPALLYAAGKFMKKTSLKSMAKGGAIFGVGTLVGVTTVRASWKLQGKMALPNATYGLVR